MVSFDNAARARDLPYAGRETWGSDFYLKEGHALLGVIAATADWYRSDKLIEALTALSDEGFFKNFSNVVLTGASMGGFAAGAFAPLAPGCTVIAMSPQATRDPKKVPWESRFPDGRARNWNLPYNDAAAGVMSAAKAYIFYDSLNRLDLRHARLFERTSSIELMPIPGGGHGVPPILLQMGIIKEVTRSAIAGTLSKDAFLKEVRSRKGTARYHRVLAREALVRRHNSAAILVCDAALRKNFGSDFTETKALALAAAGRPALALQILEASRPKVGAAD